MAPGEEERATAHLDLNGFIVQPSHERALPRMVPSFATSQKLSAQHRESKPGLYLNPASPPPPPPPALKHIHLPLPICPSIRPSIAPTYDLSSVKRPHFFLQTVIVPYTTHYNHSYIISLQSCKHKTDAVDPAEQPR